MTPAKVVGFVIASCTSHQEERSRSSLGRGSPGQSSIACTAIRCFSIAAKIGSPVAFHRRRYLAEQIFA